MLSTSIRIFLAYFGFFMLFLSLGVSLVHILFSSVRPAESLFRWVALFALGFTGIYTFIMHAFFPVLTAANIGWPTSPFQFEVAMADLAIGVLGILSFRATYGFRKATVIASIFWLWGDAVGHIRQMLTTHDFAPGVAGTWFWLDLIVPLLLLLALIRIAREASKIKIVVRK